MAWYPNIVPVYDVDSDENVSELSSPSLFLDGQQTGLHRKSIRRATSRTVDYQRADKDSRREPRREPTSKGWRSLVLTVVGKIVYDCADEIFAAWSRPSGAARPALNLEDSLQLVCVEDIRVN